MLKKFLRIFFRDEFDEVDLGVIHDILQMFLIVGTLVVMTSVIVLGHRYFEQNFWENVIVEAHGMLFDILILTFILYVIQTAASKATEKNNKIETIQDKIDAIRNWKSEEASRKIENYIKKLIFLGASKIDASNCFVESSNFSNVDLSNVNFENAILNNSNLMNSKIENTSIKNSQMKNIIIEKEKIHLIIEKGAITNLIDKSEISE